MPSAGTEGRDKGTERRNGHPKGEAAALSMELESKERGLEQKGGGLSSRLFLAHVALSSLASWMQQGPCWVLSAGARDQTHHFAFARGD